MKRFSTLLLLIILGITGVKAQSDLLYISGENDATPGNAPTLYIQGQADVYVQGGVVAENTNTRTTNDGLMWVEGTLHVGRYSLGTGVPGLHGNWTNSTGAPIYTYNNNTFNTSNTYQPGISITYGSSANTVSLEDSNQLIQGSNSSATTHFYNLSLLDGQTNSTSVHTFKTLVNADIYVGNTANSLGTLDLNDERLVTQNQIVHILNPSTTTSGTGTAMSRLDGTGALGNTPPFHESPNGGMVIAGSISASQPLGRLSRVVNSSSTTYFPVGTLVTVPSGYGTGSAYDLFRPYAVTETGSVSQKEFAAALLARDGFADAGAQMDQQGTTWHMLAGINHQYYYKLNQLSGTVSNSDQITLYHQFSTNSDANSYPNWSTCGALPASDFPQTLTVAQYDNNGVNMSWNDVCHGGSTFTDFAGSCGAVTVTPNNDFCSNTVINAAPFLDATTTVAYQTPGSYIGVSGTSQEDYTVAGLFFTVDGGTGLCDGNCAALPLSIISLTGWNEGANNHVQWITSTEENTDYFIVEKSTDGSNFSQIGTVQAAGFSSSQKTYDFLDKEPNMGNNYYRIREMYFNLQFDLTNVINVPLSRKITIASVYPNPTSKLLNVDFATANNGTVHIEIYDVLGRLVMVTDKAVASGTNTITLNTSDLTAGSYFIRLSDEESNFTDTQKFIKVTE